MTSRRTYQSPRITESFNLVDSMAGAPPDHPAESAGPAALRDLRERRGLSIDALADRSGISVATISRIERGKTQPRPHIIRRLSATLGVAPWTVAEFQPVLGELRLRAPAVIVE